MQHKRRRRRLFLLASDAAIALSVAASASISTMTHASNNRDNINRIGDHPSKADEILSNNDRMTNSKVRELRKLSHILKQLHSRNELSADTMNILHSLESTSSSNNYDGTTHTRWLDDMERMVATKDTKESKRRRLTDVYRVEESDRRQQHAFQTHRPNLRRGKMEPLGYQQRQDRKKRTFAGTGTIRRGDRSLSGGKSGKSEFAIYWAPIPAVPAPYGSSSDEESTVINTVEDNDNNDNDDKLSSTMGDDDTAADDGLLEEIEYIEYHEECYEDQDLEYDDDAGYLFEDLIPVLIEGGDDEDDIKSSEDEGKEDNEEDEEENNGDENHNGDDDEDDGKGSGSEKDDDDKDYEDDDHKEGDDKDDDEEEKYEDDKEEDGKEEEEDDKVEKEDDDDIKIEDDDDDVEDNTEENKDDDVNSENSDGETESPATMSPTTSPTIALATARPSTTSETASPTLSPTTSPSIARPPPAPKTASPSTVSVTTIPTIVSDTSRPSNSSVTSSPTNVSNTYSPSSVPASSSPSTSQASSRPSILSATAGPTPTVGPSLALRKLQSTIYLYNSAKSSKATKSSKLPSSMAEAYQNYVMPSHHHGKSSKSAGAKSGKTKSGKRCFIIKKDAENDEGDVSDGYCGKDFEDASSKCEEKCKSDDDCSGKDSCFGGISECSPTGDKYCGEDFTDASKCADKCEADSDCPNGESCYSDVTECVEEVKDQYCGTDFDDATKCTTKCESDDDCSGDESCFADITDCSEGEDSSEPTLAPTLFPTATACPDGCLDCSPDAPLQCPPPELKKVCDKHNNELYPPGSSREGEHEANFIDCYEMCKPSFCCIHDSASKEYAPSCSHEFDNCPLYYPCYIIWWKLHDTIGPATYMRVEQDEPFYEGVKFEYFQKDFAEDQTFFQQLFGHHFDTDDAPTDDTFENEEKW